MENSINDIDELIGKYLAGETSSDENALIRDWIGLNESNRKYFEQFKVIFDRAATVKEIQEFDTDVAWNKLKSRLHQQPSAKVVKMKPFWDNVYLKIAAGIIVILGVGFFLDRTGSSVTAPVEFVAEKAIERDTLPDGSEVTLNKQTQLAYTFDKRKNAHRVKLQGEAYFNIKHEQEKDFVIETEEVLIKDIGTSFNVRAYHETSTVEVVVEEGEVHFYTATNDGIFIRAGGKGVYNKKTKTFFLDQPEANVSSYKTRYFVFNDTDLATIAAVLNKVYDRKINIAPNLLNCRLTVTFNDESAEEIANVIAETLGLSVTAQGADLLLEGKGCEN